MANLIIGVVAGMAATQVLVGEIYGSTGSVVLAAAALLTTVAGTGLAVLASTTRDPWGCPYALAANL